MYLASANGSKIHNSKMAFFDTSQFMKKFVHIGIYKNEKGGGLLMVF